MNARQPTLFPLESPRRRDDAIATDDHGSGLVASVVFARGPTQPFDYAVPEGLRGEVEAGRRVRVPFGRGDRVRMGYCVSVADACASRDDAAIASRSRKSSRRPLKVVRSVVDSAPLLSPALMELARWMVDYYLSDWGETIETVVPSSVRAAAGTRSIALWSAAPDAAADLDSLKLPPKQLAAMRVLAAAKRPMTAQQLAAAAGCTMAPLTAVRRKRLVQVTEERIQQYVAEEEVPEQMFPPWELNRDQQAALEVIEEALAAGIGDSVLVRGVTGSGKTEVYMRAIERVVAAGQQAIVLVPEISLTPQTRQRFRTRFHRVAVLHSHLTAQERYWHWQRIARGEIDVVVGARSAVFAPVPRLGLIVMDEEHDPSFKQDGAPRYHARDVAQFRARREGAPLVLGSATPSLESWWRACEGVYRLAEMPQRVYDRPLPEVATIDLRGEFHSRRSRGAVSRPLHHAIRQALEGGGQVILLLNRRGFATHLQCQKCGYVVRCPQCDIALTHHRTGETAICHYCDYHEPAPDACPECRFPGIRYSGLGTERLEVEIRARFPDVVCLRMDSDSMQKRGSHEKALARFRSGEVRILLGTQMIAKGLDFPNVTLVGVVNADTALHFPDFRAAERTFQLVTQVAGRTGRGDKGGRVLVQTFSPEHPALVAALRHDYEAFARQELPVRQEHGYPPYTSLVRLVFRGADSRVTELFAETIVDRLRSAASDESLTVRVLGPAPAPLARLRGKYRFHAQLHGETVETLSRVVRRAAEGAKSPSGVQWIVDVDPLDLL